VTVEAILHHSEYVFGTFPLVVICC